MASSGLKIAFGTGGFGAGRVFGSVEEVHEVFKVMQKHGCNILDTAAVSFTLSSSCNAAELPPYPAVASCAFGVIFGNANLFRDSKSSYLVASSNLSKRTRRLLERTEV